MRKELPHIRAELLYKRSNEAQLLLHRNRLFRGRHKELYRKSGKARLQEHGIYSGGSEDIRSLKEDRYGREPSCMRYRYGLCYIGSDKSRIRKHGDSALLPQGDDRPDRCRRSGSFIQAQYFQGEAE